MREAHASSGRHPGRVVPTVLPIIHGRSRLAADGNRHTRQVRLPRLQCHAIVLEGTFYRPRDDKKTVRFAWLRRCSSAASVHRLCPDCNDAISREFQRVPAPSAQLARLHLVTIATNHPQLDSLPPDPPLPKAQLLGGAIKHADIRLDSVHHAASGTRKVTARFYVPDSRVRASFVAKIAQGVSTISFLSRLRGGGAHTPASPQGRAGPSAMPLQPSSSRMASFSRQLHHAAPLRNTTSAWPATAVPGGQALSTT